MTPGTVLLGIGVVAAGLLFGALRVAGGAFPSPVALFGAMTVTPLILVVPLLAIAIGCGRLAAEVGNRYLVAVRSRAELRDYVVARVAAAGLAAFVPFALLVAVPLVLVVGLGWVPPGAIIDPELIGMTRAEAARDAVHAATFTQLVAVSPALYGVVYSTWVGLHAAGSAMLGAVLLVVLPSRALAMLAPLALVFGQSLFVSLLGIPQWSLIFIVFPFGLAQADLAVPAVILVLELAAAGALTLAVARGPWLRERVS